MTRFIVLGLLLSVHIQSFSQANAISQLQTREDVRRFLVKSIDTAWASRDIWGPLQPDTATFMKGKFYLADLDTNGLTDLIIDGNWVEIIKDTGKKPYKEIRFAWGGDDYNQVTFREIIYAGKLPLLVYSRYSSRNPYWPNWPADTLVMRGDRFFEYNPAPDTFQIDTIHFEASGCFGTCPVFEITIAPGGYIMYHAMEFCDRKGWFYSTLEPETYQKIIQTIQYLNVKSLKTYYSSNTSDVPSATLTVVLHNGYRKRIKDENQHGTFGLSSIHWMFYDLRVSQKWKRLRKR